jgi:ATP-binding cassette subfamily F protein 3
VLEVSGLSKDYPMPPVDGAPAGVKHVLHDLNFQIERGERIALVGANGAGKSTLIRLLSRQEEPTAGTIREGHNVLTDFFAQDQYKVLDPNAQMLDDIAGIAPKVPVVELRSLLGCFMFSGDDVFKRLGVLSGGERNRYAMAKMLVSPSNFLLLDEPTNHLDLRAKDVLLEAIANFSGTVLFVSHDRYFIDGLATRVFEVEDRRLHIYPGNYEDYLWRKSGGPEKTNAAIATSLKPAPPAAAAKPAILSEANGAEAKDLAGSHVGAASSILPPQPATPVKRLNPIKLKQLEDRVLQIDHELSGTDAKIAAAEASLSHFTSADESQRIAAELESLRQQRTALLTEWELHATQLEEQMA